ncbi:hypothetical protein [Catenuloplanes atrovinosus]|uniref:Uncharacterized protein n=1 Tax=Catenuloplanes atrovinosus TaxID=137266 RepID=A0AAE3YWM5_9ACTN|nr:hypothetical protein [Catenuloplanes atrovinosus]MDR7279246.1 hypothetical protein [Catenuloplanes atrovinosus]
MGWIIASMGAVLLGVITNLVYDLIKRGSITLPSRLERRLLPAPARDHDPAAEGLIPLVTWSRDRRLTPDALVTTFAGRRDRPHLMSGTEWDAATAEFAAAGRAGRTAYLSALEVDTREHERAQRFRVSIAEGDYPEPGRTWRRWSRWRPGGRALSSDRRGRRPVPRSRPAAWRPRGA